MEFLVVQAFKHACEGIYTKKRDPEQLRSTIDFDLTFGSLKTHKRKSAHTQQEGPKGYHHSRQK